MEIVAEIIAAVLQFLLEVLLQIVADAAAEAIGAAIREMLSPSRPARPGVAACGYGIAGAVLGCVSLHWLPDHFARSAGARMATLAFAPVASAYAVWLVLTLVGRPVDRSERLRKFVFAYVFGLAFALVRFAFAR